MNDDYFGTDSSLQEVTAYYRSMCSVDSEPSQLEMVSFQHGLEGRFVDEADAFTSLTELRNARGIRDQKKTSSQ